MNLKYVALIFSLFTILQSHSQTNKLSKKEYKYYVNVKNTYEVLSKSEIDEFKVFAKEHIQEQKVFQLYCQILKDDGDVFGLASLKPLSEDLIRVKNQYIIDTYLSQSLIEEAKIVYNQYPESYWQVSTNELFKTLKSVNEYDIVKVQSISKIDYDTEVLDVEIINPKQSLYTKKIDGKYSIVNNEGALHTLRNRTINYAYPCVQDDLVVFIGETKGRFELYQSNLAKFDSQVPISFNLKSIFTYITTPVFKSSSSLCFIGLKKGDNDESIYCGDITMSSISNIKKYKQVIGVPVFLKQYNGSLIVGAKNRIRDNVDVYLIDQKDRVAKFDDKINSEKNELNCFFTSPKELMVKRDNDWFTATLSSSVSLKANSQVVHSTSKGALIVECRDAKTNDVISLDEFSTDSIKYNYSLENEAVIYFKKKGYMFQTYNIGGGNKLPEILNVNLHPIEKNESIIIDNIFFDKASYEFKASSFPAIKQLANFLKESKAKVEISGHTDNSGNDAYNKKLSFDRANALKIKLIEEGVVSDQLICVGYGSSKQLESNDSEEGRAKNRRVELKVL